LHRLLKGSTVGQIYPEERARENPRAVLKDLNWIERSRELAFDPEKRALLTEQLRRDTEFLKELQVMDYSLLVGIHNAAHHMHLYDPTFLGNSMRAFACWKLAQSVPPHPCDDKGDIYGDSDEATAAARARARLERDEMVRVRAKTRHDTTRTLRKRRPQIV
jgi:hypothetical protein